MIESNARATMDVKVRARGKADPGTFATEHRSVLYVARGKDGWKIFGFEVDQRPLKENRPSDKDDGTKGEDKKKPAKKDKKRSGSKNKGGDRS